MSTGPRIPLANALGVARHLMDRWGIQAALIAGSCRRARPMVGDLDLVARISPFGGKWRACDDALFRVIARDVEHDYIEETGLFGVAAETPPAPTNEFPKIGRAVKGLKPGFLCASLEITLWRGQEQEVTVPVQVGRATEDNWGWQAIKYTGPGPFGMWFLSQWKKRYGIPFGEAGKASIDGYLVNAGGERVPTPTEEAAFDLCRLNYIPPEKRDAIAASVEQRR